MCQFFRNGYLLFLPSCTIMSLLVCQRRTRVLDIVGKRYWYFAFSLLVIIPGLIAMGLHWGQTGQPFRLAIDFTGGTLLQLKFDKPQNFPSDEVIRTLEGTGLGSTDVQ